MYCYIVSINIHQEKGILLILLEIYIEMDANFCFYVCLLIDCHLSYSIQVGTCKGKSKKN